MRNEQLNVRVSKETIKKRDELIDYFNSNEAVIGRVYAADVVEYAIRFLHEQKIGRKKGAS